MDTHTPSCLKFRGRKGPCAQPFVLVPRYPDIRHGPCSCDDDSVPSPLYALVSCQPSDILFTIHKIAAIVVSIAVGVTVNYTRFLDEVNDWRTYLALL
jgi:hypothetical protein